MAGERVKIFDADGRPATVSAEDVALLPDGARVATPQEIAEHAVQARYDALPTSAKVLGGINTALQASTGNPLVIGAAGSSAPPTVAAYGGGVRQGLTAGLADAGTRKIVDAVGGKAAGDRYASQRDEENLASPIASEAGNIVGMVGGSSIGPGSGVARALPSAAIAGAGNLAERGAARLVGGLATKGVVGKAVSTGAKMAAQGAIETAAYSGVQAAADDVLHDVPLNGEKIAIASGHGLVVGGGISFGLGAAGSLAASGVRGTRRAASTALLERINRSAVKAEGEAVALSAGRQADVSAGQSAAQAETGTARGIDRSMSPDYGGEAASAPKRQKVGLGIDPDAGLHGRTRAESPFRIDDLREGDLFTEAGSRRGVGLVDEAAGKVPTQKGIVPRLVEDTAPLEGGAVSRRNVGARLKAGEAPDVSATGERVVDWIGERAGTKATGPGVSAASAGGLSAGRAARASGDAMAASEGLAFTRATRPLDTLSSSADNLVRKTADDLAYDSLGAMPNLAKKINARAEGETTAVGGWMNRNIYRGGDPQSTIKAMIGHSRADEVRPLIEAKVASIGEEIGAEVKLHPVRVSVDDALAPSMEIHRRMLGDETERQGAAAFLDRINTTRDAWAASGKIAPDGTMSLSDLYYGRAKMEGVAHEMGKGTKAHDATKEYLRKLDGLLVDRLNDAAAATGDKAAKQRLLHLKREYQLGSQALKAADSGTQRIAGNNKISLRDAGMLHGGASVGSSIGMGIGGPVGAVVGGAAGIGLALGGRMLRQRGDAMTAWALTRAVEQGAIKRAVQAVDDQVTRAAKGVLSDASITVRQVPSKGAPSTAKRATEAASKENSRARQQDTIYRGQAVAKWVAESRTNPDRILSQVSEAAATVSEHGGKQTSARFTSTALRAMNFVAAYVPVKERRDPLDPRSTPPLTYEEADRLVRAASYAQRPLSVFEDFERGKVTPEGLRAAKEFMPETFEQFQLELLEETTTQILRNKRLTQTQRLRLDKLGITSIRPEAIARLQANFEEAPPEPAPAPGGPPPTGNPPVNMKVQQTGFDAVEARVAG